MNPIIKKLVWKVQSECWWIAVCGYGTYSIDRYSDCDSVFYVKDHKHDHICHSRNLNEAKAAAQAHYDKIVVLFTGHNSPEKEIIKTILKERGMPLPEQGGYDD